MTLFHTNTYIAKLRELVREPRANVLVVFGDHDEFTSASNYETWGRELEHGSERGNLRVISVPNGSHFWRGQSGQVLEEVIQEWLP